MSCGCWRASVGVDVVAKDVGGVDYSTTVIVAAVCIADGVAIVEGGREHSSWWGAEYTLD